MKINTVILVFLLIFCLNRNVNAQSFTFQKGMPVSTPAGDNIQYLGQGRQFLFYINNNKDRFTTIYKVEKASLNVLETFKLNFLMKGEKPNNVKIYNDTIYLITEKKDLTGSSEYNKKKILAYTILIQPTLALNSPPATLLSIDPKEEAIVSFPDNNSEIQIMAGEFTHYFDFSFQKIIELKTAALTMPMVDESNIRFKELFKEYKTIKGRFTLKAPEEQKFFYPAIVNDNSTIYVTTEFKSNNNIHFLNGYCPKIKLSVYDNNSLSLINDFSVETDDNKLPIDFNCIQLKDSNILVWGIYQEIISENTLVLGLFSTILNTSLNPETKVQYLQLIDEPVSPANTFNPYYSVLFDNYQTRINETVYREDTGGIYFKYNHNLCGYVGHTQFISISKATGEISATGIRKYYECIEADEYWIKYHELLDVSLGESVNLIVFYDNNKNNNLAADTKPISICKKRKDSLCLMFSLFSGNTLSNRKAFYQFNSNDLYFELGMSQVNYPAVRGDAIEVLIPAYSRKKKTFAICRILIKDYL